MHELHIDLLILNFEVHRLSSTMKYYEYKKNMFISQETNAMK